MSAAKPIRLKFAFGLRVAVKEAARVCRRKPSGEQGFVCGRMTTKPDAVVSVQRLSGGARAVRTPPTPDGPKRDGRASRARRPTRCRVVRRDPTASPKHPPHAADTIPVAGNTVLIDPLQMLTPAEVAKLLRLSPRKVRAMKSAGQLPRPLRFGRSVRWRRADLEKWIAAKAA